MCKFFCLYKSDVRKFINWKILLISVILVVILSLASLFVFEKFFTEPIGESPKFEATQSDMNYYKSKIDQLNNDIEIYIQSNPDSYKNSSEYINLVIQKNKYEYLLENKLAEANGFKFRSQGEYIKFVQNFIVGIYLLVICFSANLIVKEYKTKRVNELYTYPVKKEKIFMSKIATMSTYSFILNSVFFIAITCILSKYKLLENLIVTMHYDVYLLSPYGAMAIFYLTSLVASISIGSLAILGSYIIKNNFIVIPILTIIFCLLPPMYTIGFGRENPILTMLMPQANVLLNMNVLGSGGAEIPFAPYISIGIHCFITLVCIGLGLLFNHKQNIKV